MVSKVSEQIRSPPTATLHVAPPMGKLEVLLTQLTNGSYKIVHSKEQHIFIALLK